MTYGFILALYGIYPEKRPNIIRL